MEKKKIAFIISSLNAGGAERVVSNLANELVNQFDVTIIIFNKCNPFYKLNNQIDLQFCNVNFKKNSSFFAPLSNHFKLFKNVRKILKNDKTDVIIGFMTTANIYAVISALFLGKKCIISERNHPKYSKLNKFWSTLRKHVYPFADVLVVQTKEIESYFSSFIKKERLKVILNPLSPDLIKQRDLSILKENIILNVGSLTFQKNQDLLIKAFSNIKTEGWQLLLLGDGSKKEEYINLIDTLNLQDKVQLKGNVDDIYTYYNKASIFVFSSRFEGFPNALTEAMYFGLACVSTNCPSGPSELINNGENGFLIPVGDQNALENILTKLTLNEPLRKKLSENAINSTGHFKANEIAELWKNLILN